MLEDYITANTEELNRAFDPNTEAMENLFIRGRDCQAAVAIVNPMSELTKIIAI
jgi:hypothetical protein